MSHLSRECQILSSASGQQRCGDPALSKVLSVDTENARAVQSLRIMSFTRTQSPRRNTAPKLRFLAISYSYARQEKNPGIGQGARGRTLAQTSRRPRARSLPHRTHHGAGEGDLAPLRNTTCSGTRNEAGRRGNGKQRTVWPF